MNLAKPCGSAAAAWRRGSALFWLSSSKGWKTPSAGALANSGSARSTSSPAAGARSPSSKQRRGRRPWRLLSRARLGGRRVAAAAEALAHSLCTSRGRRHPPRRDFDRPAAGCPRHMAKYLALVGGHLASASAPSCGAMQRTPKCPDGSARTGQHQGGFDLRDHARRAGGAASGCSITRLLPKLAGTACGDRGRVAGRLSADQAGDHYRSYGDLAGALRPPPATVARWRRWRQDPPFELGYITATHLSSEIQRTSQWSCLATGSVRNAPRNCSSRLPLRFMPTLITRRSTASGLPGPSMKRSSSSCSTANAGNAVFKVAAWDGANLRLRLFELFFSYLSWVEAVHSYLPERRGGDKRIVPSTARCSGAINCIPKRGGVGRSNLAAGLIRR